MQKHAFIWTLFAFLVKNVALQRKKVSGLRAVYFNQAFLALFGCFGGGVGLRWVPASVKYPDSRGFTGIFQKGLKTSYTPVTAPQQGAKQKNNEKIRVLPKRGGFGGGRGIGQICSVAWPSFLETEKSAFYGHRRQKMAKIVKMNKKKSNFLEPKNGQKNTKFGQGVRCGQAVGAFLKGVKNR